MSLFEKLLHLEIGCILNGKNVRTEEFPIPNGVFSSGFREAMKKGPMLPHKDFDKITEQVKKYGEAKFRIPNASSDMWFYWKVHKKTVYK